MISPSEKHCLSSAQKPKWKVILDISSKNSKAYVFSDRRNEKFGALSNLYIFNFFPLFLNNENAFFSHIIHSNHSFSPLYPC